MVQKAGYCHYAVGKAATKAGVLTPGIVPGQARLPWLHQWIPGSEEDERLVNHSRPSGLE